MFGDPVFQLFIGDLVGTENGALFGVDTHGHEIGLVDVQPDPAQNKALFWHEELLCEELPLSAFFSGAALHTHTNNNLSMLWIFLVVKR